MKPGIIN